MPLPLSPLLLSLILELGKYVQRYKFKNYVSNVKTSVLHYLSDSSFVYDSIRWYSSLPAEFRTDYYDTVVSVCAPHAGIRFLLLPSTFLLNVLRKYLLTPVLKSSYGLIASYSDYLV